MQFSKRAWWLAGVGLLTLCLAVPIIKAEEATPQATTTPTIPTDAIPARGLFNFREGTMEAWVQLNFDPAEAVTGYTARGQVFRVEVPKASNDLGASASFFFFSIPSSQKGDKNRTLTALRAGFARDGQEVPHPIMAECTHWKPGEWHHIAVTWEDGRRMQILFDGKLVQQRGEYARVEFPISADRDLTESALLYPVAGNQPAGVVIDELRLSSTARTPEELRSQQSPLKPDPFTLLLENFENAKPGTPAGSFTTTPYLATQVASPSVMLNGGQVVPGKFGNAWAFGEQKGK